MWLEAALHLPVSVWAIGTQISLLNCDFVSNVVLENKKPYSSLFTATSQSSDKDPY